MLNGFQMNKELGMEKLKELRAKLKEFGKINEQFNTTFKLLTSKKELNEEDVVHNLLEYIAREIIIVPQYFHDVIETFSEEIPLLMAQAISFSDGYIFHISRHRINCILLSKVVKMRPDLKSFALKYFETYPSPFAEDTNTQAKAKRSKMASAENIVKDVDIVEACYFLLRSDPKFYRHQWKWSIFLRKYSMNNDYEIAWLYCHIIGIILGLNETSLNSLIDQKIPEDVNVKLTIEFNESSGFSRQIQDRSSLDQQPLIPAKLQRSKEVVSISGIYIPSLPGPKAKPLVEVPSTISNLRKIAIGISSGKALCLQGPVGSGKTGLIEHLVAATGRVLGDSFVKVQLGDQTDSKMLLGTYRCTDTPGEFIWQPGVLTQAVIHGSWLLLEDIDLASMDIASVLASLLENNALTVPGYRDMVPITPGFQLIVTQRLISTLTGLHKRNSNSMLLLEKQLLQINIDPLTSEELKHILHIKYSKFDTVAARLISVFEIFANNKNETDLPMPKSGRLISTRDFFKWCSRAAIDFDVKSQESALNVLQDAIDVFCCSLPKVAEAMDLAKEISTHLGIVHHKAEYFFESYKPTLKLTSNSLLAGRVSLQRQHSIYTKQAKYCFTRPAAVLLERVMCCVKLKEPVLLVGETGTGKTSSVQYLAHVLGQKLIVINMNQQSDSADLLGGFKPVDLKIIIYPIRREFESVFRDYFDVESNKEFLSKIAFAYNKEKFTYMVSMMQKSTGAAIRRLSSLLENPLDEVKRLKDEIFLGRWKSVSEKLQRVSVQLKQANALYFAFIEGSLVKAVQEGSWVLLDEINLANAETLECLSGLLEGSSGSLCLLERGDKKPVERHSDFTLFACMNPATNVGKKDLPIGLRNRFTEFFVDELTDKSDLILLVNNYLEAMSLTDMDISKIVDLYLNIRKEMQLSLCDGLGQKPHFSLRSLCRALMIASTNPCGTFKRSLYEAFCLSFLTQLDSNSYKMVQDMIAKYLIGDAKKLNAVLKQQIPEPKERGCSFLEFEGYWIKKGSLDANAPEDYILTNSVRKNLKDLARVVSIGKLPVLLQGDTSVGKTSLITYLARSSGDKCVRINNHEHTDLQEYIGSYVADHTGKLVFREGVLVEAMRNGHWIILDELNLAPTDVLEALNRVLDDNRELFIPETQETVKADPNFMLFATQNPPGLYGGRKMLSRAFRNRFVELHFNEIPPKELEMILHKRCAMPPSYAKRMIDVMTDLQVRRRGSAAFAGKQGFITLRDLFRWGERYRLAQNTEKLYDWNQHLSDEGYLVLAGKVRKEDERKEIVTVLQNHWQREVRLENLFTLNEKTSTVTRHILQKLENNSQRYPNIVWTLNMRKLAVLVAKAIEFKEPVLLVGETGGGKTTICQLLAEINEQELVIVNCHMHTESSDFIGGLRPVRDHSENSKSLFEWVDGPLLQAMSKGSVFLADEISLADDSVLERLNSLLEPERTLLLAEKGIDLNNRNNSEIAKAHSNFVFIGTMNPGGDFGKKELSPALRNRFTEVWCESCTDKTDLVMIIDRNLKVEEGLDLGEKIMNFIEWFSGTEVGKRYTISIRDILSWVSFINECSKNLSPHDALIHGAYLVFLDSLGSGVTSTESRQSLETFKFNCIDSLHKQLQSYSPTSRLIPERAVTTPTHFGIEPFFIELGTESPVPEQFSFEAPTTLLNTMHLLRGMQLNKAILLEGSPGVGKTSLVTALAKVSKHKIFRVNLSDQTDISDLFGADLPVEGGSGGQFSWRDGPLLQALKQGNWILLDELNLASQSVLEGLNACLDHRGEIFIPELGKTFHVKAGTRFFACQNPMKQGGSRRGLPKSFLNRFIQVHVSTFTPDDMSVILAQQFSSLPLQIINKMIDFNYKLSSSLDQHQFGHKGSPWECNLRDLTRWCQATLYHFESNQAENKSFSPQSTAQLIYVDRMRTLADKSKVESIFSETFGCCLEGSKPVVYVSKDDTYLGDIKIKRGQDEPNEHVLNQDDGQLVLRSQVGTLRSLAYCVNQNWMAIMVGTSGVGKSSVVKTLANLAGKTLRTLPVTSAMDTTDILGGFEQVMHSQKINSPSLNIWLSLSSNGEILHSHCDCVAGLGEACTHVAAVLFALEYASKQEESVTDVLAYWIGPKSKKNFHKKIMDIEFGLPENLLQPFVKEDISIPIEEEIMPEIPDVNVEEFLEAYKNSGTTCVLHVLLEKPSSETWPSYLDHFDENMTTRTIEELQTVAQVIPMDVSEEMIRKVEKATQDQTKSKLWFSLRAGRVTASNFRAVCGTKVEKPSLSLLKRICYPHLHKAVFRAGIYGCQHEKDALQTFETHHKNIHNNCKLVRCGMFLNREYPFCAATPDALLECEECGTCCVEVKCPYCAKDTSISELIEAKKGCIVKDGIQGPILNRKHAYYFQTQMQMAITNYHRCWFVVWSKKDIFMEMIYFSESFWLEKVEEARIFHEKVILPEIIGKYYTRKEKSCTSSDVPPCDNAKSTEKTNYSRHLEEIAKEAERQTLASVQHLLMEEKVNKAAQLLEYWEEYLTLSASTTQTMDEEVQLFQRRVTKLEELLKKLYMNCNSADEGEVMLKLINKCSKISDSVDNDKSMSAGGRFEWIDSILVKCLQEGSWLLVDNVNLCSAAVLDRLNALLEPNGVLTISERGVDESGKMFEVTPHKDFRIFLTMDPKNGEISRAMRNRGVEIYILNETEMQHSNQFDKQSLINIQGLTNPNHINALLRVHEFISSLILSEKPGQMEILQCSSSIAQQLRHGIAVNEAFFSTCVEVYYKARNSSEFNCNNVLGIMRDGILRCLEQNDVNLYDHDVTLNTKDLVRWSCLDEVKYQSAIFKNVVKTFSCDMQRYKQHIPELEDKIPDFIKSVGRLDKAKSIKDLTIWCDIESVRQQNNLFVNMNFYTLANLIAINFSLTSANDTNYRLSYLKRITNNPEWQTALEKFHKVITFFENKDILPYDRRWIAVPSNSPSDELQSNIVNYAFQVEIHKLKDELEIKFSPKTSFYNYLLAVKKKQISDVFSSPICSNYITLRYEHFVFMRSVTQTLTKDLFALKYIQMLELFSWRQALHGFLTSVSIPDGTVLTSKLFESKLDALKLYYKWFCKYSVQGVAQLLNTKVPDHLSRIIATIDENIKSHFSANHKIASNFKKVNDVPEFFTSQSQLSALKILQSYDLTDPRNNPKNIITFYKLNPEIRQSLVKLKEGIYDSECLALELNRFDESSLEQTLKLQELQMLPLADAVTQLLLMQVMIAIERGETLNLHSIDSNILNPIELNGALSRYKGHKDNKLRHEIKREFYSWAANSPSCRPNKFSQAEDNAEISCSIAGVEPVILSTIIQSLVHLDGGGTSLNNFRDVERQERFMGLLLWDNMQAMADEKFDFVSTQRQIIEYSTISFIQRLEAALKVQIHDSDNLFSDRIEDNTMKNIVTEMHSRYIDLKYNFNEIKLLDLSFSHIADFHLYMGFTEMYINSVLPQVDPLAKKAMKKCHLASSLNMFEQMKNSFDLQNSLFSNDETCQHPYYWAIKEMIDSLQDRLRKYAESANVGVKTHAYSYVLQEIKHPFNSVIKSTILDDFSTVTELLTQLKDNYTNSIRNKIKTHIERFQSSIPSFEKIFQDWKQFRGSYPDIVEPLLANICQFLYGYKLKVFWIQRQLKKLDYFKNHDLDLDECLLKLASLPSLNEDVRSLSALVDHYTGDKMESLINHALDVEEKSYIKDKEYVRFAVHLKFDANINVRYFRMLKCGIQEYYNQCVITGKNFQIINPDLLEKFDGLVRIVVMLYSRQQENREQEKIESESIYRTRTKCDDKPEDQQIDDELKELFPNHHVLDFSDIQQKPLTDSTAVHTKSDEFIAESISEEDLRFVIELHSQLYKNFIKSEWLAPVLPKNIQADLGAPLMEKYQIVRRIMDSNEHYFRYNLDAELCGSLAVLLEVSRRHGVTSELGPEMGSPRLLSKKSKDFYKDPNIEEVKSCYHVLETMKGKVIDLLLEWPDQPTLNTILTVIDRILNFDIKSPISRFLTGFDILLAKCYEWEQVAHSGVSLINDTPDLISQIITWRKLELSRWKDLLNSTYVELNKPLSKWWLYMFNLSDQYITQKQVTESQLIEIVQKFVTKSPLAEFHGRLEILFEFHCHTIVAEECPESESFMNILWNVYNYFKQFSVAVSAKIKDLRTPIEKKLKDYVKIVKWKDVNYWSVKDTVDKSHKTLHKFIREYKDILLQPVTGYLTNPATDNRTESVGIWDRPQRQNPKSYHYTLDAESYIVKAAVKDQTPYLAKARKICKETILGTDYPNLVKSLDSFVADVIETSSHLKNLEVDTTLPKEKQKNQAKNILHQKHRALADLFQDLSKMGVSYKTGILETKLKKATQEFTVKPIDLTASFSHLGSNRMADKMLTIWDACELYYYRCLMRNDLLDNALLTPAQDLGIQNIERCRGFAAHLLTYCHSHKKNLIDATRSHYILRRYYKQIHDVVEQPSFIKTKTLVELKTVLDSLTVINSQIQLFLDSCPEELTLDTNTFFEIPLLNPCGSKVRRKYDDGWKQANKISDNVSSFIIKTTGAIQKSENIIPQTERELGLLTYIPFPNKQQIFDDLQKIVSNVGNMIDLLEPIRIIKSLEWISIQMSNIIFQNQDSNLSQTSQTEKLDTVLDTFTKSLLLVLQNLYKKYRKSETETKSSQENELEDDVTIQEGHIKLLLTSNLSSDLAALELDKIVNQAENIVRKLLDGSEYATAESQKEVSQCLPLFDQVIKLSEYFITQQVAAYRTTCKLTSILINIFIDLATKGFCIPPELSDEMDKEGISKPSDGMGLGEGQGERDVSDKIESEDQLDDAQPAGQEKEQNEDPDCKDEENGIEMSEDFDSKLQDKKPRDEDEDEEQSDHSDAEEQMGETEKGADQLDQEIWGDDKEDVNEDEDDGDQKEEDGQGGEKDGDEQLEAKDDNKSKDKSKDKDMTQGNDEETEKNHKEINEMNEPEYDDEQTDPYHGNQQELPEPEPMDLPDDLQLDEGEEKDGEQPEENPFDIDEMKEQQVPDDKPEESTAGNEEKQNDEETNFSSDDEDITRKDEDDKLEEDEAESKDEEKPEQEKIDELAKSQEGEDSAEETADNEESALDQNPTNQENVEAMEVDDADANDNTQATHSDNLQSNQPIDETNQEENPDKDGMGQSQMEESESGHSVQTSAPQEARSSNREQEKLEQKKERPGESNLKRSLGDVSQPVEKRLKTMDAKEDQKSEKEGQEEQKSDMYQHIKEAKEDNATQNDKKRSNSNCLQQLLHKIRLVLDSATKEQAEEQNKEVVPKDDDDEDKSDEAEGSKDISEDKTEDMEPDTSETLKDSSVKPDNKRDKKKQKQHPEGDIMDDIQDVEIEGDLVKTTTVPRGSESTHHTQYHLLQEASTTKLSQKEINEVRSQVEHELSSWKSAPTSLEAEQTWQKISSVTSSLAQDLSEKLRLVLEPTQASHLKGDFRTGRRINMRKVIPYIASQFRKDKIWLRRTKPSKREYQIVLAIDDSSSMADNHSKELAFESIALISKALSLLESGQLAVVSFGENIEVHHKLCDPFTDKTGVQLLQNFQFDQEKTHIGKLVDFVTEMFNQNNVQTSLPNAKLLLIVSDGRGVFSEGKKYVQDTIRRAKLANIFIVFVIIDNPESKSSILDIRTTVFEGAKLLGMSNYMDEFPFSFYLILRDINSLPDVLSDALMQWFDMITSQQ